MDWKGIWERMWNKFIDGKGQTSAYLEEFEQSKGIGAVLRIDRANNRVHLRIVTGIGKSKQKAAHQGDNEARKKTELKAFGVEWCNKQAQSTWRQCKQPRWSVEVANSWESW